MEENEEKKPESNKNKRRIKPGEFKEFFIGILLLAFGLFMLSMKVRVTTGWYGFYIGNFMIPSGTIVIPLVIGIIWYVMNPKSFLAKLIIILGSMFIVGSIIMSVSIRFTSSTLFDYILMLILIAAGLGLVLKTVFTDKQ